MVRFDEETQENGDNMDVQTVAKLTVTLTSCTIGGELCKMNEIRNNDEYVHPKYHAIYIY